MVKFPSSKKALAKSSDTFTTPNVTAQCALATSLYTEYTGVTEVVDV